MEWLPLPGDWKITKLEMRQTLLSVFWHFFLLFQLQMAKVFANWIFPHNDLYLLRCLGISFRWLSEVLSHRGHKAIVAGVWVYSASVVTIPWAGEFGQ